MDDLDDEPDDLVPGPIPDEQAALLAAICAEPDDDTARLVYADWLQENGDDKQAAYIRASLKPAKGKTKPKPPKPPTDKLVKKWTKALGFNYAEPGWYERGLPTGVVYWAADQFLREAGALFARLPIRELNITWQYGACPDDDTIPAMLPLLKKARLESLYIANGSVSLKTWKRLINCPHLRGLRQFSMTVSKLGDEHAVALANCSNLSGLTGLDLSENQIGCPGVLALARSPHLANVERLSLASNNVYPDFETCDWLDPVPHREVIAALTARFGSAEPLTGRID